MTTTPDQAGRGLSDYDKGREWSQRGWGAPEAGPSDEFYRGYEDAKAGRVSSPCMSRHFGNEGKPRPPVEWAISYGCTNEHAITTEVCDGCAMSLTDGKQRCAKCIRPMVVTDLARLP